MKYLKNTKRILLILLIVALVLCVVYASTTINSTDSPITLTMDPDSLSRTQGTLIVKNTSRETWKVSRDQYIIQVKHSDTWCDLPPKTGFAFTAEDVFYIIKPGRTVAMELPWKDRKNEVLSPGTYRIVRSFGDKEYTAEFTITSSTPMEPAPAE